MGATKEPMVIYDSCDFADPSYFIGNVRTWPEGPSFLEACEDMAHENEISLASETLRKKWIRLVPDSEEDGWLCPYDAEPGARGAFEAWHVNVEE